MACCSPPAGPVLWLSWETGLAKLGMFYLLPLFTNVLMLLSETIQIEKHAISEDFSEKQKSLNLTLESIETMKLGITLI